MNHSPYQTYRTDVAPIHGALPAHWEEKPLRRIVTQIQSGVSVNAADEPAAEGEVGVLKTSCVYSGSFDPSENKRVVPEDLARVACPVRAQALVVSRMNTPELVGAAGLASSDLGNIFLPDRLWQVHLAGALPAFVHYWTMTPMYRAQVRSACAGTSSSMQNLSQDDFLRFVLPLPTAPEQIAVARFLDRETGKIDALIAEQEKLLALLAEKRQATITRAVTRGLNSNAPLKDSGVQWLGQVPAHWDVVPIKRLSPVLRGASPRPIEDPRYFDDEGEYSWVRISDVSASDGTLTQASQRLSELGSSLSVKLEPGQLFVSIAGTVGKPCITAIRCCIHDGFVYFPRLQVDPRFLFRVFEAGSCYGGLGKLGTQLNLNTDTIGSICVALPPPSELASLLAHLDERLRVCDGLAAEVRAAVDLLRERRAALISAAVTGKIDVRKVSEAIEA